MSNSWQKKTIFLWIIQVTLGLNGMSPEKFQENKDLFNLFSIEFSDYTPAVCVTNFITKIQRCKNTQEVDETKEKYKKMLSLIVPFWKEGICSSHDNKGIFIYNFLSQDLLETVSNLSLIEFLPSLLSSGNNKIIKFNFIARDPRVFNELLYIYNFTILWDFKMLKAVQNEGFILNGSCYLGKSCTLKECYLPQTEKTLIDYLKVMLRPKCSREIRLQQKSFLLFLKLLEKDFKIKIPKVLLLNHILPQALPDHLFRHFPEEVQKEASMLRGENFKREKEWIINKYPDWYKKNIVDMISNKK